MSGAALFLLFPVSRQPSDWPCCGHMKPQPYPLLAVAMRGKPHQSTSWETGRPEGYLRVRSTFPEEEKVRLGSTRASHCPRSLVCLSRMGPGLSQQSTLSFSVISVLFGWMAYRWGRRLLYEEVDSSCNLYSFI